MVLPSCDLVGTTPTPSRSPQSIPASVRAPAGELIRAALRGYLIRQLGTVYSFDFEELYPHVTSIGVSGLRLMLKSDRGVLEDT